MLMYRLSHLWSYTAFRNLINGNRLVLTYQRTEMLFLQFRLYVVNIKVAGTGATFPSSPEAQIVLETSLTKTPASTNTKHADAWQVLSMWDTPVSATRQRHQYPCRTLFYSTNRANKTIWLLLWRSGIEKVVWLQGGCFAYGHSNSIDSYMKTEHLFPALAFVFHFCFLCHYSPYMTVLWSSGVGTTQARIKRKSENWQVNKNM
jgi:hypothetical protein